MSARGVARAFLTLAATLALALALALALGMLAEAEAADFTWDGVLAPGQTVRIQGVNGDLRAERAEGRRAEVTAEKTARRSDPDEVRIEVVPHAGGVTICALYPGRRGRPAGRCEPTGARHHDTGDSDVAVHFRVRLPAGVRLEGHTVNGSLEGDALDSDVEMHTVNGSVRVSTRRTAEASTVNGSIRAATGTRRGGDDLSFSTVNGSITLELPEDAGAELRASSVNGRLSTDLPITWRGQVKRHSLQGRLGAGGPRLELSTVNGDIRLVAAR